MFYTDIFQVCSTFVRIQYLNRTQQVLPKIDFHTDDKAALDAAPEKEQEQQEHETMCLTGKPGVGSWSGRPCNDGNAV